MENLQIFEIKPKDIEINGILDNNRINNENWMYIEKMDVDEYTIKKQKKSKKFIQ